MMSLPNIKNIQKSGIKHNRNSIIYRQDSLNQLANNDTRRYFNSKELRKEMVPSMMKLDKYFSESRKYILEKYNLREDVDAELKPHRLLQKLTSNPLNFFRSLESDKDKREFLQMMHRKMDTGFWKK